MINLTLVALTTLSMGSGIILILFGMELSWGTKYTVAGKILQLTGLLFALLSFGLLFLFWEPKKNQKEVGNENFANVLFEFRRDK